MLVDSHCHLNSLADSASLKVADWFKAFGHKLIDSSIGLKTSRKSIQLSRKYSFVYNSLGFHPFFYNDFSNEIYQKYKEFLKVNDKVVALGEVGLDYKSKISLNQQEEIFKKWVELAKENNISLLIHHRLNKESWYNDKYPNRPRILAILDQYFSNYQSIVFHCFSYSPEFLRQIIDRGGFVSFSLNLLRKNKKIINSLKKCPLDKLLLETDSPYMKIGDKESTPLDIKSVYSYAAELKNISKNELKGKIFLNVKKVFKKIR
ncbi:MAG: TatD family hydrolase [Candidatus Omnitrophica bacterium]|nr:TatD family hydrolase [Candidatus Omnitrophota bacterium]MCF7894572.1 TatD family hydrolase [Candidatus Omnitrophota bacterium]